MDASWDQVREGLSRRLTRLTPRTEAVDLTATTLADLWSWLKRLSQSIEDGANGMEGFSGELVTSVEHLDEGLRRYFQAAREAYELESGTLWKPDEERAEILIELLGAPQSHVDLAKDLITLADACRRTSHLLSETGILELVQRTQDSDRIQAIHQELKPLFEEAGQLEAKLKERDGS